MTIYQIENTVNGFVYIGLTTREPQKRWKEHLNASKRGTDRRLYRAMRKYGADNFKIVILATLKDLKNSDILFKVEKAYIKEKNSYWFGYNNTVGGRGWKWNRPKRGRKPKIKKKTP